MAAAALLSATLGGCVAEQAYQCQAWCGTNSAATENMTVSASSQDDALTKCFDKHAPCPSGIDNLPKCTCK